LKPKVIGWQGKVVVSRVEVFKWGGSKRGGVHGGGKKVMWQWAARERRRMNKGRKRNS